MCINSGMSPLGIPLSLLRDTRLSHFVFFLIPQSKTPSINVDYDERNDINTDEDALTSKTHHMGYFFLLLTCLLIYLAATIVDSDVRSQGQHRATASLSRLDAPGGDLYIYAASWTLLYATLSAPLGFLVLLQNGMACGMNCGKSLSTLNRILSTIDSCCRRARMQHSKENLKRGHPFPGSAGLPVVPTVAKREARRISTAFGKFMWRNRSIPSSRRHRRGFARPSCLSISRNSTLPTVKTLRSKLWSR